MSKWPLLRDLILFFFGLGGAAWEIKTHAHPDGGTLVFFSACIGLPAFLPDGIRIGSGRRDDRDKEE
jgi:hypothetical protein